MGNTCLQRAKQREAKTGRPVGDAFLRACNRDARASARVLLNSLDFFARVRNNSTELEWCTEKGNTKLGNATQLRFFTHASNTAWAESQRKSNQDVFDKYRKSDSALTAWLMLMISPESFV